MKTGQHGQEVRMDGRMKHGRILGWTLSLLLSSGKEKLVVKEAHIMGSLGQLAMGGKSVGQLVSWSVGQFQI